MNFTAILQKLQDLFQKPKEVWQDISLEYVDSTWRIIKDYYLIFYFLLPLTIGTRLAFEYRNFSMVLLHGLLSVWVILSAYLVLLYLVGMVAEEVARFLTKNVIPYSGTKLAYFASLPFVALNLFLPIPVLGWIIVAIGFAYSIILLFSGSEVLLGLSGQKKWIWFVALIISFILLFMLVFACATFLIFLLNLI